MNLNHLPFALESKMEIVKRALNKRYDFVTPLKGIGVAISTVLLFIAFLVLLTAVIWLISRFTA